MTPDRPTHTGRVLLIGIAVVAVSSCTTPPGNAAPTPTTATVVSASTDPIEPTASSATTDDDSVVAEHAGEPWFLGTVPDAATPADRALEPIRLGMINQEDTPIGSYPEMRAAVEAAVAWVNAELGGVGGRPIELSTCVTRFDPAASAACAESLADAGAVAFVGGVDVTSTDAVAVIERRGLVTVGGIPATLAEQRSPRAFYFSGGDAGALAAFMSYAAQRGDRRVALAYGREVDSFEVAARDYGAEVGRSLGLEVDLVPFSVLDTDFTPLLDAVTASGADSLMVLAATSACVPVMTAAAAVEMPLFLTGACAGLPTTDAAGDAARAVVFNAEGAVDGADTEASIYLDVIDRYALEPAGGAGTVAFRGFMNLYSLLLEVGADDVSADALAAAARRSVDRPSFWGHPFTCDGNQVPGLQALCAPQQILFTLGDGGSGFRSITGFIDTPSLFASAVSG